MPFVGESSRGSAPKEEFDELIARMETIDRQLAPFEMAMQPVQVSVYMRRL